MLFKFDKKSYILAILYNLSKKNCICIINDNRPGGKGKKHNDDADMERTPTLNTR